MQQNLFRNGELCEAKDFHTYYTTHLTDGYVLDNKEFISFETATDGTLTVSETGGSFIIDGIIYHNDTQECIGSVQQPTEPGFYVALGIIATHDKMTGDIGLRVQTGTVSSTQQGAVDALKTVAVHTATKTEYLSKIYILQKDAHPVLYGQATTATSTYPMTTATARTATDTAKFRQQMQEKGCQLATSAETAKQEAVKNFDRLGICTAWIDAQTETDTDGTPHWVVKLPADILASQVFLNGRFMPSATVSDGVVSLTHASGNACTIRIFKKMTQ